jgi:hypothetical protein
MVLGSVVVLRELVSPTSTTRAVPVIVTEPVPLNTAGPAISAYDTVVELVEIMGIMTE